jgi:serine/threonine protein kinase
MAGRLQHPNIVTIYDVGRDGEISFIAMEYVEGRPLSRFLRPDVALTDEQRFLVLEQTAEALSHAHDRSVLHRDVKPANILIRSDGVVKVSDFGIGKLLLPGASELTQAGQLVGSPSYMSPEQVWGEALDGRSDLFSLGIVAYEMFTGARPFPGDTISSLAYQIVHADPRDPLLLRPDLPPAAAEILRRSLAKKRDERYSSARELLRDLSRLRPEAAADAAPTAVIPFPTIESGAGDRSRAAVSPGSASAPPAIASGSTVIVEKRGGAALLFGVAALVLAAAAFLYVLFQPRRSREPSDDSSRAKPPASVAAPAPAAPSTLAGGAPPASLSVSSSTAAPAAPAPPASTSTDSSATIGQPRPNPRIVGPKENTGPSEERSEPQSKPSPSSSPNPAPPADRVYHTGHGMKFQISPDQARLYVDGYYVGVADDWDNHGGGKVFPFTAGTHTVHAVLPGYRDLHLQIVVEPSAREAESAGDDMARLSKEPFAKVPKVDYATISSIYFSPKLGPAEIKLDGKPIGTAAQFSSSSPLKLSGPTVHDIQITRPGSPPTAIRVLTASTAGKDNLEVKE